jgi:hypothetical protein
MRYFDLFGIIRSMTSLVIWPILLMASMRGLTGSMGLVTPLEIASVTTVYMRQVVVTIVGIGFFAEAVLVLYPHGLLSSRIRMNSWYNL